MRIDLIDRTPAEVQAARAAGLPDKWVQITGQHEGELEEPRNFIREAARTIKTGKAIGRKHSITALRATHLMMAACTSAKVIGRWSATPGYNPLPDLVALRALAAARLGPVRGSGHPVTVFRAEVAGTIRDLGGPAF